MPHFKHDRVTVESFFQLHGQDLQLKLVQEAAGLKRIIREPTVNRPGLGLTGFTKYFAYKRVQVIGNAEAYYLKSLPAEEVPVRLGGFFSFRIPCVVFSRNLHPPALFLKAAKESGVPVFQCPLVTMNFINRATLALESMFAPRGTQMGSMVDILGVGVIIRGESGIGKSESVLALLERGYSLVADDVTKVTLLDGKDVMGTSSEITRDHMEVRGIGIINVASMFGIRSIRRSKKVELVVTLKEWGDVEDVDRVGMEQEYVNILGQQIPHMTIPVRPGRDLARLIEVAALHIKLTNSGYNAARDLNERLIQHMSEREPE
jgi:HPr kinase/phosphorylase